MDTEFEMKNDFKEKRKKCGGKNIAVAKTSHGTNFMVAQTSFF
jgi:hypothetical protein